MKPVLVFDIPADLLNKYHGCDHGWAVINETDPINKFLLDWGYYDSDGNQTDQPDAMTVSNAGELIMTANVDVAGKKGIIGKIYYCNISCHQIVLY